MEYLTVVMLIHDCIIFILSILCLYISISVLLNKNLIKKCFNFSPTITIYLTYLFLWSLTSFLSCAYLISFWRPETSIYDGRILYLIGLPSAILMMLNPIMESTLCFDRCLSIIFPLKYSRREKNLFACFAVCQILFVLGLMVWINKLIPIFNQLLPTTNCRFFGCIVASLQCM